MVSFLFSYFGDVYLVLLGVEDGIGYTMLKYFLIDNFKDIVVVEVADVQ